MKIKGIPKFENLSKLKVSELTIFIDFSLLHINTKDYDQHFDLMVYKIHYFLIPNLDNFF